MILMSVLWYLSVAILIWLALGFIVSLLSLRRNTTDWRPPTTVRQISGDPVSSKMRFAVRAPLDIGTLMFAHSTLHSSPLRTTDRWSLQYFISGVAGAGLGWLLAYFGDFAESNWLWFFIVTGTMALLKFPLVHHSLSSACLFVGMLGMRQFGVFPSGRWFLSSPTGRMFFSAFVDMSEQVGGDGVKSVYWLSPQDLPIWRIRVAATTIPKRSAADNQVHSAVNAITQAWKCHCLMRTLVPGFGGATNIPHSTIRSTPDRSYVLIGDTQFQLDNTDPDRPRLLDWPLMEHMKCLTQEALDALATRDCSIANVDPASETTKDMK